MRLPNSVQEIADVIGRERALYLIGQLPRCVAGAPGKQSSRVILYVPKLRTLPTDHYLVRILGWNDAVKMARAFGGELLQPPNCSEIYRAYRDRMVREMRMQGMTHQYIAAVMAISDRQVRNICAEIPQQELPKAANDNAPIQRKARAANGKSG